MLASHLFRARTCRRCDAKMIESRRAQSDCLACPTMRKPCDNRRWALCHNRAGLAAPALIVPLHTSQAHRGAPGCPVGWWGSTGTCFWVSVDAVDAPAARRPALVRLCAGQTVKNCGDCRVAPTIRPAHACAGGREGSAEMKSQALPSSQPGCQPASPASRSRQASVIK